MSKMFELDLVDFETVCRSCLLKSNTGDMESLHNLYTPETYLGEIFKAITSLEFAVDNDGLPTQICRNCVYDLQQSYKFVLKSRDSDKWLRTQLDNTTKTTGTNNGNHTRRNSDISNRIKSEYTTNIHFSNFSTANPHIPDTNIKLEDSMPNNLVNKIDLDEINENQCHKSPNVEPSESLNHSLEMQIDQEQEIDQIKHEIDIDATTLDDYIKFKKEVSEKQSETDLQSTQSPINEPNNKITVAENDNLNLKSINTNDLNNINTAFQSQSNKPTSNQLDKLLKHQNSDKYSLQITRKVANLNNSKEKQSQIDYLQTQSLEVERKPSTNVEPSESLNHSLEMHIDQEQEFDLIKHEIDIDARTLDDYIKFKKEVSEKQSETDLQSTESPINEPNNKITVAENDKLNLKSINTNDLNNINTALQSQSNKPTSNQLDKLLKHQNSDKYSLKITRKVANLNNSKEKQSQIDYLQTQSLEVERKPSTKCKHCNIKFVTHSTLLSHYRYVQHVNLNINCQYCSKLVKSHNLYRHMWLKHRAKLSIRKTVHKKRRKRSDFLCTICGKSFQNRTVIIRRHLLEHSNDFYTASVNQIGTRLKTAMPVEDSHRNCYKTLDQSAVLNSKEIRYSCSVCDVLFTHKFMLNAHMLKHSEEIPFACTVCDDSFKRKRMLNAHMLTHTGENPYLCMVCNESFMTKAPLVCHMSTHTKWKSYSCETCNMSFNRKVLLTDHLSTHTEHKSQWCACCNLWHNKQKHICAS